MVCCCLHSSKLFFMPILCPVSFNDFNKFYEASHFAKLKLKISTSPLHFCLSESAWCNGG